MQARMLELARQGLTDAEAAKVLTSKGYRSPRCSHVLVRTVQVFRQRHRVLRGASRTHPRHIPGWLTMAEMAKRLQVSRSWIERRISNGTIVIARDAAAKRCLFPDTKESIATLQRLKSGKMTISTSDRTSANKGTNMTGRTTRVALTIACCWV